MNKVNKALLKGVRSALEQAANPEDAEPMRAYMKSEMPFYGVKKDPRKKALKTVFAAHSIDGWEELRDTTLALWRDATHREERYAALDLTGLKEHRYHLSSNALEMYEEMIVSGAWWDLVDVIATHRIGEILRTERRKLTKIMKSWSGDQDMWKRRTSIICQNRHKDDTDRKLLAHCIEKSISSPEFFLRKAIGWALRELSKHDPKWVVAYVQDNADRLSGLSKREALRRIT